MVGTNWPPIGNPILYCESNRHVTDDVTWSQNVKVVSRDPDIFEAQYLDNRGRYMVRSYWLPTGNHTLGIQWSRDTWRHVTPKGLQSWPQYLWSLIYQKPCEIDGRYKLTTHRKPHIANPMVTWQMTSRDPKRSRSWPRYLWSSISRQPCEIHGQFTLTTNKKPHIGNPVVTWQMTSCDHERSKSWPPMPLNLNSSTTVQVTWSVHIDYQYTRILPDIANPMVTWPMTSLDLKGQSRNQDTFKA